MYNKADSKEFTEIRNQMPVSLAVFLTDYTDQDYDEINAICYLSQDKKSGYAIKPDGDLISVFSLPGAHHGVFAVKSAIENGATMLDCIGDFLVRLYTKFGFEEYKREPWNDAYAPKDWDYEQFGRPDIVYMKLS